MQNMLLQLTQKMGTMQTQIEKLTELMLANTTANRNNQLQHRPQIHVLGSDNSLGSRNVLPGSAVKCLGGDPGPTMVQNQMNEMSNEIHSLGTAYQQKPSYENSAFKGGFHANPPNIDPPSNFKLSNQSLFIAIRSKDLGKVSQIVDSQENWWEIVDEKGNSAIIAACSYPDSKVFIVSYLIDQVHDQKVIAKILIHENKEGLNCYLMAAKTGNLELLKYIEGLVPNLLKMGFLKKVNENAEQEIKDPLRHRDLDGNNALLLAATSTNLEAVKHLIQKAGFNIFSKNGDGFTPMLMAIDSGRLEIVDYLGTSKTENLEIKTSEQDTPLTLAIQSKSGLQMIKLLVEKFKVSIFEGGFKDRLPFSIAAEFDEYEILEYLFSQHSKAVGEFPVIQYNDTNGDNALHLASKYAGTKILRFLLNKAIDMFTNIFFKSNKSVFISEAILNMFYVRSVRNRLFGNECLPLGSHGRKL